MPPARIALAAYLGSGRSVVRPALRGVRLRWRLFRDILRVGAVAALITVQTNLTIAITTGIVGAARLRRHRRLRHRLTPRIPAGAADLRVGRPARRDGRHQHRRRPTRACCAYGVDRRCHCRRYERSDRPLCRGLPARLAFAVRHRLRHDRSRVAIFADSRPVLRVLSASVWRSTLPRKAPGGCCGRCSPTAHGSLSRWAAAGSRCIGQADCRVFLRPLPQRWSLLACSMPQPSPAAPGSVGLPGHGSALLRCCVPEK